MIKIRYRIIINSLYSSSSWTLHDALEVVPRCLNIQCDGLLFDIGVAHDDHNIGGWGEFVNKGSEFLIFNDHGLELEVGLDAAQLKLLDNVTDFLKSVDVFMFLGIEVRNNEEGWSFEEDYLISFECLTELLKVLFKGLHVWQQEIDDLRPCLVQCFIPNGCPKALNFKVLCLFNNLLLFL